MKGLEAWGKNFLSIRFCCALLAYRFPRETIINDSSREIIERVKTFHPSLPRIRVNVEYLVSVEYVKRRLC